VDKDKLRRRTTGSNYEKAMALMVMHPVSLASRVAAVMEAHAFLNSMIKDLNHPRYQQAPTSPKRRFKKGR